MAYIALYRKWRPKDFDDVVGQAHITETLQKAIETDKVAHAYLFSGPRGTGKTSTAKIFARAMNCIHGPTSHPCNTCEVCRHIMSGESMDVVEIDAASNRSIEDIRTLRETIKFMPAEGHKKIYIIDEVHMLTTEAFNALLKTLEEPPSHVIFILATTEPERIPMTILSRCQRYEFRRITSGDIAKRLLYIAKEEHIDLTKGAAHILAVQADGGMRDALSMLDQCVSNTEGTIDEQLVRDLLGLIGRDWLFSLSDAVFQGKGDDIIQAVDDIIHMGKEPQVILTELLAHLRAIMLCQAAPKSDTLAAYADSMKRLTAQSQTVTPERIFSILQVLQQALLTAKTSPEPRIAVEMGLLMASRAVSASSDNSEPVADSSLLDSVLSRLTQLEQQLASMRQHTATVPVQQQDDGLPASMADEEIPFPEEEEALVSAGTDEEPENIRPAGHSTNEEPVLPQNQKTEPSIPEQEAPAQKTNAPVVPPSQYDDIWKKTCAVLDKEKKKAVFSCVRNGKIVYIGQTEVILVFQTAFMAKRANREDYYGFVDQALAHVLGKGYHMRGYLKGDAELEAYEKKNSQVSDTAISSPAPKAKEVPAEPAESTDSVQPASLTVPVSSEEAGVVEETVPAGLQPATADDMSPAERTVLEPLLKTVGDCNIYIEHKPNT
jgi:DNA polymerase-3 subunit gamma/tau